jgi:hypothetical protein
MYKYLVKRTHTDFTVYVTENYSIKIFQLKVILGNMISYEKELDIDNKLHNYLKITRIINNVFRLQKPLRKQEQNYTTH